MKGLKGFFFKVLYDPCFLFFYLPILVTMVFSFNSSKSLTKFTGFSLRWYEELVHNNEVVSAVYVSLTIAAFGNAYFHGAWNNQRHWAFQVQKDFKRIFDECEQYSILNPEIVTAIGLMLLFSSAG